MVEHEPLNPSSSTNLRPIRTNASGRSVRSKSSRPQLGRIYTGHFPDDQSVYHSHEEHEGEELTEVDSDLSEDVAEENNDETALEKGTDIEGEERPGEKDLERGNKTLEKKKSTRSTKDLNLVTWDGPEDPSNPKNWSRRKKWAATFVVSSFTFITPVSSSMVAPAISTISTEFGVTSTIEQQLLLSVFILAYAVGPVFLGPLSEIYGRVPVLQLANLFYLVFNLGCGFARNKGEMIAFRFLSGLGGSAPLAIGGGVLSDCWRAEERGAAVAIYSLAPLLGPAIGPIAGGFITEKTTWRWVFWATSIVDAAIQVSGLFFLQETYPAKLLHNKAEKLRKETANPNLKTEFEHPERSFANTMERSLVRPFKLLGTQPIVQALAVYMAFLYGLIYLVISTFPVLWEEEYRESIGIGGLNYISLGLGFFIGAQTCARVNDRIYRRLKKRNNGVGKPEFRVPLMVPGSLLVPIGLFIYGWSAQYHTHWIVPNIGATLFSAGIIVGFQCIQTYLVDSYTRYAASAIAAATVLRSLAGFALPLAAPSLYASLDYGWGNSLLAFLGIVLGLPAPIVLWKFGEKMRKQSPFAAGGGD